MTYRIKPTLPLVISCLVYGSAVYGQDRELMYLTGFSPTSSVNNSVPNRLELLYEADFLPPVDYYPGDQPIALTASLLNEQNVQRGFDNMIGIGHDLGGIIVREMDQSFGSWDGMILMGTPNRGSHVLNGRCITSKADVQVLSMSMQPRQIS